MHFGLISLVRAALLYGALCIVTSATAQTPAPSAADAPGYVPMPFGVDVPHIALLLPVDSSTFRRHAEALRDGFIAASRVPHSPPKAAEAFLGRCGQQ